MQNQDNPTPDNRAVQDDDEINLMDLVLVLAKHNRFIIKLTASVAVLAVIYALLQPNIYTAKTVILPPQQGASTASMLMSQLGGLASLAGGAVGIKSPNELHIGMLKSHTLADKLIARFKLQQKFKAKTMEAARGALAYGAVIRSGKDGFINIEYSSEDPIFAASIANAYVEELDKLNNTLAITEASRKRLFFEKQLKETRGNLIAAEIGLKQTQERTGLIQLEAQGQAIIAVASSLRAQVTAAEVKLQSMGSFATPQNPDYQKLQQNLTSLRAQLVKAERNGVQGRGDIMVPTGKLPETGLEYLRKMRDLKYQETLFEILSKQLEIAKIDEAKEAPLIQVVDKALVPEEKSKPKRSLIVILATLVAFFIAVLLVFLREAFEQVSQDPASAERMNLLRRYLRRGA
ncbi:KpsE Capsule polysaccharide export protein [Methylophilaceae bacterium]